MATEVNLPALGESVTEGTVTRWLKQVGDTVAVDEPLLEVSTDKVDTEIPSPVAGTLLEIKANEDDTVEVGATLALIGDESESGPEGSGPEESGPAESEATPEAQPKDEENAEKKAEQEQEVVEEKGELPPGDSEPEAEKPAASSGGSGDSGGSSTSVTLPALGESVTEGTVTRWLKKVGDEVAVDEPLLEVSTDKVDTEIPSPVAGTLLEIKAEEDETVEVGAELAVIGSGDAAPAQAAPEAQPKDDENAEKKQAQEAEIAEREAEPEPEPEPELEEETTPAAEKAPAPSAQAPSSRQARGEARREARREVGRLGSWR